VTFEPTQLGEHIDLEDYLLFEVLPKLQDISSILFKKDLEVKKYDGVPDLAQDQAR
jgi:hypothetical protein